MSWIIENPTLVGVVIGLPLGVLLGLLTFVVIVRKQWYEPDAERPNCADCPLMKCLED